MDQLQVNAYLPWIGTAIAVGYAVYLTLKERSGDSTDSPKSDENSVVNLSVQKDNNKVVHTFDIEDMSNKTVFCRCWRSSKFPYCDGSHVKHNEKCGDNVGPLIIQNRA